MTHNTNERDFSFTLVTEQKSIKTASAFAIIILLHFHE